MKTWIQSSLERTIETYGDYEAYAEKMWKEHCDDWEKKTGYKTSSDIKYAYICGAYQAMLGNFLYHMQAALEKLDELNPSEE